MIGIQHANDLFVHQRWRSGNLLQAVLAEWVMEAKIMEALWMRKKKHRKNIVLKWRLTCCDKARWKMISFLKLHFKQDTLYIYTDKIPLKKKVLTGKWNKLTKCCEIMEGPVSWNLKFNPTHMGNNNLMDSHLSKNIMHRCLVQ